MSERTSGTTALEEPVTEADGSRPPEVWPAGPVSVIAGPAPPERRTPPPPAPPAAPPPRRKRRLAVGIAVAAAVVLVGGLLVWAPWATNGPGAPKALGSEAVTAGSAVIRWSAPSGGPTVDRYLVLRDGVHVGTAAATATSYRDQGLRPGVTYRYQIVAESGDTRSGRSAAVVITTLAPPPVDLALDSATSGSVALRWSAPPDGPPPDSYDITRDGATIATVPGATTSYTDHGLTASQRYAYQVTAVWGDNRSDPSPSLATRTLALSPSGLTAGAVTATTATFSWSPSPEATPPDSYEIVRDGSPVGRVPGTTTTYTDTGLAGATTYDYEVRAVWSDQQSDLSEVLAIRTNLSDVPLQGQYSVKVTIVKTPGGGASGQVGQNWTDKWKFTPQCGGSTCNVVVAGDFTPPGFSTHSFDVTLTRSGSEYSGSTKAHITHCETLPGTDVDVQNTVTVRITGPAGGPWDSWSGTLVVSAPPVYGAIYSCPAQSWTTSLNATSVASGTSTVGA